MKLVVARSLFLLFLPVVLSAHSISTNKLVMLFEGTPNGGSAGSDSLRVTSDPDGLLFSINVADNDGFLNVASTSGTTSQSISISANTSGISATGVYTAHLTVCLVDFSAPCVLVQVFLNVASAANPPKIGAAPTSLNFQISSGGTPAQVRNLNIFNEGGGSFTYAILISYPPGQLAGWLAVTPSSCVVNCDGFSHQVIANAAGVPVGSYTATMTVEGQGALNKTIPVSLTVTQPPVIFPDPFRLTFEGLAGLENPPDQTLKILNTGDALLQFSISTDQPWLSVTPLGGTSDDEPSLHQVRVNTQSLAAGTHMGRITISSTGAQAVNSPLVVAVLLNVRKPGTISASPADVAFSAPAGSPRLIRRIIQVISPELANLRWTATVSESASPWLRILNSSGTVPGIVLLEADATSLGAATLTGSVLVSAEVLTGSSALRTPGGRVDQLSGGLIATVPVSMTVTSTPPTLQVEPPVLRFISRSEMQLVPRQQLVVDNSGGPALNWVGRVTTRSGGDWLHLLPGDGAAPTVALVEVDPRGLSAGVHQGSIFIDAGPQKVEVPVTYLHAPAGEALLSSTQAGVSFDVVAGTGALPAKELRVLNLLPGALDWTASLISVGSPSWITISGSGQGSSAGATAALRITPSAAGLTPGAYPALVEIAAPQSSNRSHQVLATLNVAAAGSAPSLVVEPSGAQLTAMRGAPPTSAATLRAFPAGPAQQFQAGVSTLSGGSWLSAAPASGMASPGAPAQVITRLSDSNLAPGTYNGLVTLAFADGTARAAAVTLNVTSAAGGSCFPTRIVVTQIELPQNFQLTQGRATALRALVTDNCGVPLNSVAVLARFSSGETALPLHPSGDGVYTATWTPSAVDPQLNVNIRARNAVLADGVSIVVGRVGAASNAILGEGGVVSGASFAPGGPLPRGGIISLFGGRLAPSTALAASIPLPRDLAGTKVWIGGIQAPLFFVSEGQINAQAPFELQTATLQQVMVERGGQFTTPQTIVGIHAQPGLFPLSPSVAGPGRAVVQNQDLSINTPQNPERRGRVITVFLTGQGDLDQALASGAAAPGVEPLARAAFESRATIGGQQAQIFFMGLTPGFVGLLQANLLVPETAPIGSDVPLQISIGGELSNVLLVAVSAN